MTHFILLVIVPESVIKEGYDAVMNFIHDKMYPYSEDLEIEPYIEITSEQLNEQFIEFKRTHSKEAEKYNTIDLYSNNWCNYKKDANGNVLSTYNNKCLYDWYVMGGRWDGHFNSNLLNGNAIKVSDLPKEDIYSHIVDKEGNVYKKNQVGWFATYAELINDNEWKKTYNKILEENHDDYFVCLDCHI